MKILSIYVFFLLSLVVEKCNNFFEFSHFKSLIITGVIIKDDSKERKLYIQNLEDGTAIELRFYFDKREDMQFDEFDFVEIQGQYSSEKNIIYVDTMYPVPKNKCNYPIHIASVEN